MKHFELFFTKKTLKIHKKNPVKTYTSRGYGVKKGIPTLVIAACSADDVVAISGFGLFLGITFNTGAPMYELIFHGPIEVIIGVLFGIFWGVLAQWIPNHDHKHVAFFRWLVLLGK